MSTSPIDFSDPSAKTFSLYQVKASSLDMHRAGDLPFRGLCLACETGEVCETIKKLIRDDGGELSPERAQKLLGELGDVLWYLSTLAENSGFTLQEVAEYNLAKLFSRRDRGVLQGDGDER